MNNEFETVIGLEVHVQLKTKSKIFCACSTEFACAPNTNICPICSAYPGVLPLFNKKVLELAVRTAVVLNCSVNDKIYFERKNYFYPDLPKAYQISQYKKPLGENGWLEISSGKKIGITRAHLEEDAGKLVHKQGYSLVDLNRTGIPLLEIVSEPDISDPQEAFDYLTYLKLILQYIEVSDCDMEKGFLRCDANISTRKKGEKQLGVKVELKNMNSFRGVRDALFYEEKRQREVLSSGGKIFQETRLWDVDKSKTIVMRTKEEAHDYRYFPEPDLLDFYVHNELIDAQLEFIPELPLSARSRLLGDYGLSEKDIDVLIANKSMLRFYEDVYNKADDKRKLTNWFLGPFLEQINNLPKGFSDVTISVDNFVKIVNYFCAGKINNVAAKKVLSESLTTDKDPDEIIKEKNLLQISGTNELECVVDRVISENSAAVGEYLNGADKAMQFLIGQVMKETKGKANPQVSRALIEEKIKK
ncbi:MAG: Asp-tRNA(Asn)/Glu-tRNA(Gln) amidotransferase subunit GatB [Candidatus Omnitrophica bacterium]|nr:Asp-tRNA(Asn)/Glu-tRNA(Gln) amidotransferase subunit GatB [Candidatus Omnitrophota bacterium]